MKRDRTELWLAGALALLVLAVYAGTLPGGFLNWDDPSYVTGNPELRLPLPKALASIFGEARASNYNPLQRLTYLILWKTFGADATAFRIASLLLHALAAWLLYRVLFAWMGHRSAAFAAAALFAVHPANVENAAWISESKSLLAAVFGFGAILAYLRGAKGWKPGTGVALGLFTLALLSKLSVVALPALFLLLDLSMRRKPSLLRYALFLPPILLMGYAQVHAAAGNGAILPLHGGSLLTHAATIVGAIPGYVQSLVWPFGHMPKHPFDPVVSGKDFRWIAGVFLLAVGTLATVRSWRGDRRLFVALPWFLLALLPTLMVPIPIILADRYLYLAMPFLLGAAMAWAMDREDAFDVVGRAAALALVVLYGFAAASYAPKWKDSLTLWEYGATRNEGDALVHVSLGAARAEKGNLPGAVLSYRTARQLDPDGLPALHGLATAYYFSKERLQARDVLVDLVRRHPEDGAGWAMLGIVRAELGDERGAEAAFAEGAEKAEADPAFWKNLAAFRAQGDPRAAKRALEKAHALVPEDREVVGQLLAICEKLGLTLEAARWRIELARLGD